METKEVMQDTKLLKLEEVAILIGSSYWTVRTWYVWKSKNKDHPLAQLLPDPIQSAPRQTRYWKQSDIWKLLEFKSKLPRGRNGVMGNVTTVGYHKKRGKKSESESA